MNKNALNLCFLLCLLITVPTCFAQSEGGTGTATFNVPPMLPGATNGTIGPPGGDSLVIQGVNTVGSPNPGAPYLQGATMGTIGPDSGTPMAVMDPGANAVPRCTMGVCYEKPKSDMKLYCAFLIPVISAVLFFFLRRKKTSMWEMGVTASIVLLATGVAVGLLSAGILF